MGATGFGYDVARQFDLHVIEPKPGLVPLLWDKADEVRYKDLAGVSSPVSISVDGIAFNDDMLFTHAGLSGPAILQASSYWDGFSSFSLNLTDALLGDYDLQEIKRLGGTPAALLSRYLPKRMVDVWCNELGFNKSLAQCSNEQLLLLKESLVNWRFTPSATVGFSKAEVTVGGVDTKELSSKTMEVNAVPGLYFIGEVVDVTGWLGGYNFQWAWSSGWAAGQAV
jgi:predicted Rossmann fold flavoprotein